MARRNVRREEADGVGDGDVFGGVADAGGVEREGGGGYGFERGDLDAAGLGGGEGAVVGGVGLGAEVAGV